MRVIVNIVTFVLLIVALVLWVFLPWFVALALLVLLLAWLWTPRLGGERTRSVTAVGLSTLPQRLGSAAVIVVGIAGVVGVLVALLAMGEGYRQALTGSGSEDVAIILRGGSSNEVSSLLSRDNIVQIEQGPGIARNDKGEPLSSAELVVAANLPVRGGGPDDVGSVQLRGAGEQAFAVRPKLKLTAGRRFQPGLRELIVGAGALRQFAGIELGKEVRLGSQLWTVVGVFSTGDAFDSEIWASAESVADAYRRGSSRTTVIAKLTSPDALAGLKKALGDNPQLAVDVSTTLEFYAKQSEGIVKVLRIIGITVGAIMGIGALFGALNTMFAAVAARAREIATLRAIGFAGPPVVMAVMIETLLLALLGGLLGGAIAWALFDGFSASTMAAGSVGKLSFSLRVTPPLLWEGLKWALAIGLNGGLYPALRAARLPVTTALREL